MRGFVLFGACTSLLLALPGATLEGSRLQNSAGRGFSSMSASQFVSPTVVMTWAASGRADESFSLELLVLWRGSPGWFLTADSRSSGGTQSSGSNQGGRGFFSSFVQYGDIELTVSMDVERRIARLQGQEEVQLHDDNVVFVDGVDTALGPQVVRTVRIEPDVPVREPISFTPGRSLSMGRLRPDVEQMLRRSPEVLAFLQCDVRLPESHSRAQPIVDLVCGRIVDSPAANR